jgi:DNA polymerase-3 subunit beta
MLVKRAALRITRRTPDLPVLEHVRIQSTGESVSLGCYNLDTYAQTSVNSKSFDGEFTCLANVFELAKLMKSKEEYVTLTYSLAREKLDVTMGALTVTLPCMPVQEFPPEPAHDTIYQADFPAKEIVPLLNRVSIAASDDETRPVLNMIDVEIAGGKATFAAADGFRLSIETIEVPAWAPEGHFYIPARLVPFIQKARGLVRFSVCEDKSITVSFDNVLIHAITTIGTFPDYRQVVPKSSTLQGKASFYPAAMLAALEPFKSSGITTRFECALDSFDTLNLSQRKDDSRLKTSCNVKIESSFRPFGLYAIYLYEILKALRGEPVTLETVAPTSPIVLTQGNHTHLIMPMRLD